jgi:hypothetical protein
VTRKLFGSHSKILELQNVNSCTTDAVNGTIYTGSLWKSSSDHDDHGHTHGDGVLSDQAIIIKADEKPLVEDEIEFHEGWTPSHYE